MLERSFVRGRDLFEIAPLIARPSGRVSFFLITTTEAAHVVRRPRGVIADVYIGDVMR